MKIVITGGAGNISQYAMAGNGHEAVVLSRNPEKYPSLAKKAARMFLIAAAMNVVVFIIACVGSSDNQNVGKNAEVPVFRDNKYLGRIPAIYAWREAEKEKLERDNEAKIAELVRDNKANEIIAVMQKTEELLEKINTMAGDGVADEKRKVYGREIPFTYSDALVSSGELFYDIEKITVTAKETDSVYLPAIAVSVSAKKDIAASADFNLKVYYMLVNTVDSTLARAAFSPFSLNKPEISVAVGEHIGIDTSIIDLRLKNAGKGFTYFAGVKFVTRAEFELGGI